MNKTKIIALIISSTISLCHFQAYAFNFSNFYFLGDSLSDLGNNTTEIFCNNGPCTNPPGHTWAYDLGQKYDRTITPSSLGGTDYAYSGAPTSGGTTNTTVNDQVNQLITDHNYHLDHNALYAIWAGGDNLIDVLFSVGFSGLPIAATTASNDIRTEIGQLVQAGARFLMVGNLPDLSKTPLVQQLFTQSDIELLRVTGIQNFNEQLRTKISSLSIDVIQLDFYGLLNDILAQPLSYGFTNTTGLCDPQTDPGCEGILFVYTIHPTTSAHQIIADYVYSVLRAPELYANLANFSINTVLLQNSSIKQQLTPNVAMNPEQRFHIFATSDLSKTKNNLEATYNHSLRSSPISGTIGFTDFINTHWEFGGAYSHGHSNPNMSSNEHSFTLNNDVLSLFTSYFKPGYYINSILNGGLLNFNTIERTFYLGPKDIIANGTTKGTIVAASLEGGSWLFKRDKQMSTGPYATADLTHVTVNGYTEHNAPNGVNIAYNNQNESNLNTGIGWRIRFAKQFNKSQLISNIYSSINHQWLDYDRTIYFHVASIAGSHGSLPVNLEKSTYFSGGFNLGNELANGIILSLGYNIYAGTNNLLNQNVNLAISLPIHV